MQISRHWRLNSQRYRLQGVRYENGAVSIQARPNPPSYSCETKINEMMKDLNPNLAVSKEKAA